MPKRQNSQKLFLVDQRQQQKKDKRQKLSVVQPPKYVSLDQLRDIAPMTFNQKDFFDSYCENEFIILHGVAGTGKTFCALYKAIEEVLDKSSFYDKVIIVRSAVQSRDIGHLPGDAKEKMAQYRQPYEQILSNLFERQDAWEKLEAQRKIEFLPTSFLRGTTFDNSIIIVDETQNMNWQEISTIITRIGNNSKIIFCGDYRQTDLNKKNDQTGIHKFMQIAERMKQHKKIEFDIEDIVRSQLVKSWIIAELNYQDSL